MIQILNEVLQEYREEMKRLRNENRLYKESITSISHDIRTPLTSAKGYTQMLSGSMRFDNVYTDSTQIDTIPAENGLLVEKQQEYVKKIEQRIDDVTDMLNQLFEYARVEAGELEFLPERINLNNLFAETISMFYNNFVMKNCEPVVEIVETPCYIYADKRALIRVIENLIKNALVHGTENYIFSLKKKRSACNIICFKQNGQYRRKRHRIHFRPFLYHGSVAYPENNRFGTCYCETFHKPDGRKCESISGKRYVYDRDRI